LSLFFLCGFDIFSVQNQTVIDNEMGDDEPITLVHVIAAGDAMCHSPQITHAKNANGEGYDFSGYYQYLADILATGDLNLVNLETTLSGEPYTGYPQFCAPNEFALALQNAGFNFFMMANNHCADKGTTGIVSSINKIRNMKIEAAGTYLNEEDRTNRYPAIVNVKDITFALLNYTYSTNGLPVYNPLIVNNLNDTIQIKKDLQAAQSLQPDVIIAFLHWGNEYQQAPDKKQKEQAQFFFQHGADIIIGSHPHVIQPVEYFAYDQNEPTKKKLIYWSLGNLISNQRNENTDGGILASFTIIKNKILNQVIIENQGAIPYWVYKNSMIPPGFFVLPTKDLQNEATPFTFSNEDRAAYQRFINNTNKIIK
jgi:poly-gamma-glutamate synthesis protein (capsule biosynthesis protein)